MGPCAPDSGAVVLLVSAAMVWYGRFLLTDIWPPKCPGPASDRDNAMSLGRHCGQAYVPQLPRRLSPSFRTLAGSSEHEQQSVLN